MLNITDLSSIESRVLGWVSDCKGINGAFATGKDTYKIFASKFYNTPYDLITKEQRNFSKPPVLGCGFGLAAQGLMAYAEGMGTTIGKKDAETAVNLFRVVLYPEVPEFWSWCKSAVFHVTQTGGKMDGPHGLYVHAKGEFLFIHLPSGRQIAYHKPAIRDLPPPWDKETTIPQFTFMGRDKFSHKWTRISASPGHVCENIIQALARDILGVWMIRAAKAGHSIILHVHDEICVEDDHDVVEELNALIRVPIEWAPGLLLDAEGFTAKRYRKG